MERREQILTETLQIVVVVCILLTLGPGGWLGLSDVAQAVTGVMALLLGVFLTAYSFTLLRQLRKPGRCASLSDRLSLSVMMLTGLIPVALFIWTCLVRFKVLVVK